MSTTRISATYERTAFIDGDLLLFSVHSAIDVPLGCFIRSGLGGKLGQCRFERHMLHAAGRGEGGESKDSRAVQRTLQTGTVSI